MAKGSSTGETSVPAKRRCSRGRCARVEQQLGDFGECGSCNAAVYCSERCEELDRYTGHAACTLKALAVAAETSGWDDNQFQQAAKLLSNNIDTSHLPAILAAIQAALRHAANSGATAIGLAAQHPSLLPALIKAYDAHLCSSAPRCSAASYRALQVVENVAAATLTLLAPVVRQLLLEPRDQVAVVAFCKVEEAFRTSSNGFEWLQEAVVPFLQAGEIAYQRGITTKGFLPPPFRTWVTTPAGFPLGFASRLLASVFNLFERFMVAAGKADPLHRATGAQLADAFNEASVAALSIASQSVWDYVAAARLPGKLPQEHGMYLGLEHLVLLENSRGAICDTFLKRPDSASPLLHMLQQLVQQSTAKLAGDQWLQALCCGEMKAVEEWGHWMASREGLAGLEVLAGQYMRPVLVVVDQLLNTTGLQCSAQAAVQLRCTALKALAHLVPTNTGRKQLADAKCITGWAEMLPVLPPEVQQHVLLVLFCSCNDWLSEEQPYWCKLHLKDEDWPAVSRTITAGTRPGTRKQWAAQEATRDALLLQLGTADVATALGAMLAACSEAPIKEQVARCIMLGIQGSKYMLTESAAVSLLSLIESPHSNSTQGNDDDSGTRDRVDGEPVIINGIVYTSDRDGLLLEAASILAAACSASTTAAAVLATPTVLQQLLQASMRVQGLSVAEQRIAELRALSVEQLREAARTHAAGDGLPEIDFYGVPYEMVLDICIRSVQQQEGSTASAALHMIAPEQLQIMDGNLQLGVNRMLLTVLGRVVTERKAWPQSVQGQEALHSLLLSNEKLWEGVSVLLRSNVAVSSKADWATPLQDLVGYLSTTHEKPHGMQKLVLAAVAAVGGEAGLPATLELLQGRKVAMAAACRSTQQGSRQAGSMTAGHADVPAKGAGCAVATAGKGNDKGRSIAATGATATAASKSPGDSSSNARSMGAVDSKSPKLEGPLAELVEAADRGVWSDAQFQKATQLLLKNPRGPQLPPLLAAIRAALAQAARQATYPAPRVHLTEQHRPLVNALVKAHDAYPLRNRSDAPPQDHLAVDDICYTLLQMAAPSLQQLLLEPADMSSPWAVARIITAFIESRNHIGWLEGSSKPICMAATDWRRSARLVKHGFFPLPPEDVFRYKAPWGLPMGLSRTVLGYTFNMNDYFMEAKGEARPFQGGHHAADQEPINLSICIWLYEVLIKLGGSLPPHVEATLAFGAIFAMRHTWGNPCDLLLKDPDSAKPLLFILKRLATLPASALAADQWQLALCSSELKLVGEWGQWIASREGMVGLEVLAMLYMEPTLELTHKLLTATGLQCSPTAVAHLHATALRALAHLATTNNGRRQLAGANYIQQWAALLPALPPDVQQHVVLVLHSSCNQDVDSRSPYWYPLYARGVDAPAAVRKLPAFSVLAGKVQWQPDKAATRQLMQQVGSAEMQEALRRVHAGCTKQHTQALVGKCALMGLQEVKRALTDEEVAFLVPLAAAPASGGGSKDWKGLVYKPVVEHGIVYSTSTLDVRMAAFRAMLACCQKKAGACGVLQERLPDVMARWLDALGSAQLAVADLGSAAKDTISSFTLLCTQALRSLLQDPGALPAHIAISSLRLPQRLLALLPAATAAVQAQVASCSGVLVSTCRSDSDRSHLVAALATPETLLQLLQACISVQPEGRSNQAATLLGMLSAKQVQTMEAKQQLEVNRQLLSMLGQVASRPEAWPQAGAETLHSMLLSNVPLWEGVRLLLRSEVASTSKADWAAPLLSMVGYLSSIKERQPGLMAKAEQAVKAAGGATMQASAKESLESILAKMKIDDTKRVRDQAGKSARQAAGTGSSGSDDVHVCAACGPCEGQARLCSGCKLVRYCSAECQRGHWKQHKVACKAAQAAALQL